MEIVKLDEKYLKFIMNKINNFPEHGIGLKLYFRDKCFFIPMTSKIIESKSSHFNEINKFFKIGNKNGTLLILNYLYIDSRFTKKLTQNKTIISEHQILQNNRKTIEKKLLNQINFNKSRLDKLKLDLYNEFFILRFNPEINKKMANKYLEKALSSMSALEKINNYQKILGEILNYKVLEKVDSYEVETLIKIKSAWEKIIRDLGKPLTLEYIIEINSIIASHQALKVGVLRDIEGSVSGEFTIPIPKRDKINMLLKKINESSFYEKEEEIFKLFFSIILEQWFFDGNKRTAFSIFNKILIENGLGILLLEECNNKEFEEKLYSCYVEKYKNDIFSEKKKKEFFIFLKEKCITKF